MSSPFGSFTGVEPFEFVSGVHLRAVGGEQVLLCRVTYERGKEVPRHRHEHTEQASRSWRRSPRSRSTTCPTVGGTSCWAPTAALGTSSARPLDH